MNLRLFNRFVHSTFRFIQCLLNIINEKETKGIFAAKLLSNLAVESK
jgi:hypothetical protein